MSVTTTVGRPVVTISPFLTFTVVTTPSTGAFNVHFSIFFSISLKEILSCLIDA